MSGTITRRTAIGLLISGLSVGVIIGLMVGAVLTTHALEPFTCTEYSPITGECVVFTNQRERARYD